LVVSQQAISRSGEDYILIVRSIEERARFDLLIRVAQSLRDRNFVVAGKGPLLDYYRGQIKKNNIYNITMLGYVKDDTLIGLYKNCEMVLNIAEYGEGFGLPIIEAYLFNKPVIASNKCAIPEVIISQNYLFENTVESIKNKILEIEDSKRLNYRSFYDSRYGNKIIAIKVRKLFNI
jgi:glycosyltransferase involved in cell wall biosynthesis